MWEFLGTRDRTIGPTGPPPSRHTADGRQMCWRTPERRSSREWRQMWDDLLVGMRIRTKRFSSVRCQSGHGGYSLVSTVAESSWMLKAKPVRLAHVTSQAPRHLDWRFGLAVWSPRSACPRPDQQHGYQHCHGAVGDAFLLGTTTSLTLVLSQAKKHSHRLRLGPSAYLMSARQSPLR